MTGNCGGTVWSDGVCLRSLRLPSRSLRQKISIKAVAKDATGNVSSASVNVTVIKSSQVKTTTDIRAINWAGDHKWSSFIHSSARNDIQVVLFHVFDPVGSVYIIRCGISSHIKHCLWEKICYSYWKCRKSAWPLFHIGPQSSWF